jgi:hypothetical protein
MIERSRNGGFLMKKIVTLMTTLLLINLLSTCTVTSHPRMMHKGSGGWGMGGSYQRLYNPKTVTCEMPMDFRYGAAGAGDRCEQTQSLLQTALWKPS